MFEGVRSLCRRRRERIALRWLMRIDSGECGAKEQASLQRWLKASHAHRDAFAQAGQLHRDLQSLGAQGQAPALNHPEETRHPWPSWILGSSVAALMLFLLLSGQGVVKTGAAQHSVVALADGSRIELNADTRLRVTETDKLRRIELLEGEAYFDVVHDDRRPFVVLVNGQRIQDIGTQFNVRARRGTTRIGVMEGEVAINRPRAWFSSGSEMQQALKARQVTECDARCAASRSVDAQTLEREIAWRRRQLIVDNRPLGEVIEELNHYTRYKLVLLSEREAQRAIGGVFYLDDPEAVLRVLGKTAGLRRVQMTPYLVVLLDEHR